MTIEFHTEQGLVKQWVLDFVRDRLVAMHNRHPGISRAEVYFKEWDSPEDAKACDIDLTILGDAMYVHRRADSYEDAAREVLQVLQDRVAEQMRRMEVAGAGA